MPTSRCGCMPCMTSRPDPHFCGLCPRTLRLARLLHAVMDKKRMMRPAAMHYLAIATDGDGTLMRGGRFGRRTVAALRRWRAAGRKLLLVTGETPKELCE